MFQTSNMSVTEASDESGTVVSTLEIPYISIPVGGQYTCEATNSVGIDAKSSFLYVYGKLIFFQIQFIFIYHSNCPNLRHFDI